MSNYKDFAKRELSAWRGPFYGKLMEEVQVSNYKDFAKRELSAWRGSFYGKLMDDSVLELLDVFAKQGHSGASAPVCVKLFAKLALFEPLTPLTGADEEWGDIGNGTLQNKRCFSVFKDADGKAYDSRGRIFRKPNGRCYSSAGSRVDITFPYCPKVEYVDVDEEGRPIVSLAGCARGKVSEADIQENRRELLDMLDKKAEQEDSKS